MLQGFQQKPVLLSFGPGKDASVNDIIVKLAFKKWRANIDFNEYFLVPKQLNNKIALKYRIANSGIPVNANFNGKYFVRPTKLTQ